MSVAQGFGEDRTRPNAHRADGERGLASQPVRRKGPTGSPATAERGPVTYRADARRRVGAPLSKNCLTGERIPEAACPTLGRFPALLKGAGERQTRPEAVIADRVAVCEESFAGGALLLFREPRLCEVLRPAREECKTLRQHLDSEFGIGAKRFRRTGFASHILPWSV